VRIFSLKKRGHLDQGGCYPRRRHLLSVPLYGIISVVMHIHSMYVSYVRTIDLSVRRRMAVGIRMPFIATVTSDLDVSRVSQIFQALPSELKDNSGIHTFTRHGRVQTKWARETYIQREEKCGDYHKCSVIV
jgi:hypothetical protein